MRLRSRIIAFLATVATVGGILVVTSSTPAFAYDPGAAAYYADQWWNGRNSNYMYLSGDDCTNFVSQALHTGGFSYVKGSSTTDDSLWWAKWTPIDMGAGFYTWSHSFTIANDLYQFLMIHYPGGYYEGQASSYADQDATYTPDTVHTGDVIFYDFDSNGVKDHAGIQVGSGTDPATGWYGNYQDQHTNNRHHAFWSLLPYNTQWATTTITFVHVDAGNY